MNSFINIEFPDCPTLYQEINEPYYCIILLDGRFSFSVDFNSYECNGKNILFLSPYQLLTFGCMHSNDFCLLRFHGDFYCIEYHKEEVACNGILFNAIYEKPFISVSGIFFQEIIRTFQTIKTLENSTLSYDLSIIRSYLQLILALSSKEKQIENEHRRTMNVRRTDIINFKTLIDNHFTEVKSVAFYADQYNLSVDTFSKKVKSYYGKSPSKLIRERLTLEAKKLLHLTYKSIKEIASDLGFKDEFYFSRYFKKEAGVSPKTFREKVGISIVAK